MLTRIAIENFKGLADCTLELDHSVVFVGPNNSGKTTALQALSLWETGLHAWMSKRSEESRAKKRVGVTINRRDLVAVPMSDAKYLWKKQRVRIGSTNEKKQQKTENVRITITVDGMFDGQPWTCGLEFDYANTESFYCRPTSNEDNILWKISDSERAMLNNLHMAFLPPMSGLEPEEIVLQPGTVDRRIGEGQTGQVLRNLCLRLYQDESDAPQWDNLVQSIQRLFGIKIHPPTDDEWGKISMYYHDQRDTGNANKLELSSAGRGFQQTLLILAFLYLHPGAIILLDEPDAHLEILRQRQIYEVIKEVAKEQQGQVIVATHSEVLLNESAEKDTVVAFLGKPHPLNNKSQQSQLIKSLSEYGWDQYLLAEQKGWVLYLEGSTDLDMLRGFARLLDHPVNHSLDQVFFHPIGSNVPELARKHFFALREAKADLIGYALFDNIPNELRNDNGLHAYSLKRKEIENYFCTEDVLVRWARGKTDPQVINTLLRNEHIEQQDFREQKMREAIAKVEQSMKTLKKADTLWSHDLKASDEVLKPVIENYYEMIGRVDAVAQKARFCELIEFMNADEVDSEIREVLDGIQATAAIEVVY